MQRHFFYLVSLLVLSFAAALGGLGYSYNSFVTPRTSAGELYRVHGDNWIENGAEIRLSGLAQRGNRLMLAMEGWRPDGMHPAQLRIYLCGALVSEVTVDAAVTETVYLTGNCEPRTVRFEVVNPFIASPQDQRELGAQLRWFRVVSHFGFPLVSLELIGKTTVLIFAAALLLLPLLASLGLRWLVLCVPIACALLLSNATYLDPSRVYPLWLAIVTLAIGALLARTAGRKGYEQAPSADSQNKRNMIWLLLIMAVVAFGAALRLYGLDFGLPNHFHPDEVPKINAIERMRAHGDLNPRYFLHPSLLLYSAYAMNWLVEAIGPEIPWRLSVCFSGRIVSLIAGTVSIYLLYAIGTRLYNRRVGLGAALLLAVYPLHVTCSRYLKEDALLTCFLLAAVLLAVKAVQEQRRSLILLCGISVGAACATKYTGLLGLAIVGSIPWLKSRRIFPDLSYLKWTAAALVLVPLTFVLLTPYAVLDYPRFLKDFGSEKHHAIRGHTITIDAWSQFWTYHFWYSMFPGMTLPAALIGVAGLGVLLWRRRIEDLYIVAMVLLFYLPSEWVRSKPAPQPERYILPCLPFLAIAAAEFIRVAAKLRIFFCVPILAGIVVISPLLRTVQLASEINDDTRDRMAEWMINNLPHGSRVFLDWKRYAPVFWHDEFKVTYIPRAEIGTRLTLRALKASEYDYMVLSSLFYDRYFSQPNASAAMREHFREVFRKVPVVLQMRPRHGTYGFHNPTLTLFSLRAEDFAALEARLMAVEGNKEEIQEQYFSWRHR